MSYKEHYSVMKQDILEWIPSKSSNPIYLDLTFGAGGHSLALLNTDPNAKVIAFDQDPDAQKNAQKLITEHKLEDRLFLIHQNFEALSRDLLKESCPTLSFEKGVDGIVADLGVSSHHFDCHERGFSFRSEAPLDMRMNYEGNPLTAKEILNEWEEEELSEIFSRFGEERFSKRIAENIIEARQESPLETTKDLENIIFHSYPKKMRFGKTHPATRVFQALRIAVNDELGVLDRTIPVAFSLLKSEGRMGMISFHSLEDRIIKRGYKSLVASPLGAKILTKKPLVPSEQELAENKRSRSAKLRVIERV